MTVGELKKALERFKDNMSVEVLNMDTDDILSTIYVVDAVCTLEVI